MRLALLVAYQGTRFSGWQIQETPCAPLTVQGVLESAVSRISGRHVRLFGSGRTDAGVHAHGQVVHGDVPDSRFPPQGDAVAADGCDASGRRWRHSLNALLPADVRVLAARTARPDFHARISALHKTYFYDLWQETAFTPPRLVPFVWPCGPLDLDAMNAALRFLIGRHNFATFRNVGTETESDVRTLMEARLVPLPAADVLLPPHAPGLRLVLRADGFLKQMVRNITGMLAACGRGKLSPDAVPALLAAEDRRALRAATAPPQGLTLARVTYPDGDGFAFPPEV